MKTNKLLLALVLFSGTLYADDLQQTQRIDLGKGWNTNTAATSIDDSESPDMLNMAPDVSKAIMPRRGSKRYISQAFSTQSVTGLFKVYQSSGSGNISSLLAVIGNRIVVSTSDTNRFWTNMSTFVTPGQRWTSASIQNSFIFAGSGQTDPLLEYNISADTVGPLVKTNPSTFTFIIRPKYLLNSRNQLLAANFADVTNGTTYYPSFLAYTRPLQKSSFTFSQTLPVRADDGEDITGIGEMFGKVHIFKRSTISELTYTILDPYLGDQQIQTIATKFGCIAPGTLVNNGQFYIFLSNNGVVAWDGGRRSRLLLTQEYQPLSLDIQDLIDRVIEAKTYGNAIGTWYPNNLWYVLALEDPNRSPHGVPNFVIVYDFVTQGWYPFGNWLPGSLAVTDGLGDDGQLMYGDAMDGYVHEADVQTQANDSRKEVSIHPMDNQGQWTGSTQETTNVLEGTASLKISLNGAGAQSSMTYVSPIVLGEWYDKSKASRDDKISFKIYPTTITNITSIRLDLEVNDISSAFDTNFTSVTITTPSLTAGNTAWTTIEVPVSSFPFQSTWVDLSSETVPFANSLTLYGVRFVLNGISSASILVDDLRFVQATQNPLNAYFFTKQFDMGSSVSKDVRKFTVNMERSANTNLRIDIYKDFGGFSTPRFFNATVGNNIFVGDFGNTPNISRLDSMDFHVIEATYAQTANHFDIEHLASDGDFVYAGDASNLRVLKISVSSLTARSFVGRYGTLGTGATSFASIHQIGVDDKRLYVCDWFNHKVMVLNKSNLTYVASFGGLGTGTTNFHIPTAITADITNLFIGDDGNQRLLKYSKGDSSWSYISQVPVDMNTAGEMTLANNEKTLYLAYNKINDANADLTDVILEKRNKNDLSLVTRVVVKPDNSVLVSSYGVYGDIALLGPYVLISFTDDRNEAGSYYIQKRLASDLSLVSEHKSRLRHFGLAADNLAFKPRFKSEDVLPGIEARYFQMKFSQTGLDPDLKIYNMSIFPSLRTLRE